jgi:GT2 family glycosyltransferase
MTYHVLRCVESIRQKSTYSRYEVVLVHNRELDATLARRLSRLQVRPVTSSGPFNWSASMNLAARRASGAHLLFLNDDTEIITPDWLEALLEYSERPEIGAVGAKLLFPDGRLQHAGVTLLNGRPKHCFYGFPGDHPGYHGSTRFPRNVSAVTGACLMTRAEVFQMLAGFDESFPLDFNDIDYCLRLRVRGLRVVYTPLAQLYHLEAATKGTAGREQAELFRQRWQHVWPHDPYYNPNLSAEHEDYRIKSGEW